MELKGTKPKILVVDDAPDIRDFLHDLLVPEGYDIRMASNGQEALRTLFDWKPALVLTDLNMPHMDGFTLLERIREVSEVPVIILSALEEEPDKVRGLRIGADDYVVKPIHNAELLARVDANLRRAKAADIEPVYQDAALFVDFARRQVRLHGEEASLSPQEFRLLAALVRHAGTVLSPEQLLDLSWGIAEGGPESVRVYVGYLRRKLGDDPKRPRLIQTVRGFGYRYVAPAG